MRTAPNNFNLTNPFFAEDENTAEPETLITVKVNDYDILRIIDNGNNVPYV
jgi:hypothetical protein